MLGYLYDNVDSNAMADTTKMLLVFCDGTGMDGTLADDSSTAATQYVTNVLRLSRAVKNYSASGRRQIVFYQSGVGSEADFKGTSLDPVYISRAQGTAVASKIRDAYVFIAQNYVEGDDICLFGFSRGAYTARKLSGLIEKIGLLEREKLGSFFSIWKALVDGTAPTIPAGTRHPRIKCVGVWDTVGSVLNESNTLHLDDTFLPETVDFALHALSIHENRARFLPTLWTIPASGLAKKADGATQVIKQIWFPGAHSDVGGGYEKRELADISLFWMAGEIKDFVDMDMDFLSRTRQRSPDAWGTSQPHNMFDELSIPERLVIGVKTRLDAKLLTKDSVYHPSFLVSPIQIKPDPANMVTLDTLKKKFGASWQPTCSELNATEKQCKVTWGGPSRKAPAGAPGSTAPAQVHFDTPSDLFG